MNLIFLPHSLPKSMPEETTMNFCAKKDSFFRNLFNFIVSLVVQSQPLTQLFFKFYKKLSEATVLDFIDFIEDSIVDMEEESEAGPGWNSVSTTDLPTPQGQRLSNLRKVSGRWAQDKKGSGPTPPEG